MCPEPGIEAKNIGTLSKAYITGLWACPFDEFDQFGKIKVVVSQPFYVCIQSLYDFAKTS
jgi:hypothetical protein